ncbi:MAG: hypothetical protein GY852_11870, partial [bacterium]|nr:hypothetical protein [bacterium]
MSNCSIEVCPQESLSDEPLTSIRIKGLSANTEATVTASTVDESGLSWMSSGLFKSNDMGEIDLSNQAPLSGTFSEIDPSAMLWSMRPGGYKSAAVPLFSKNTISPLQIELSVKNKKEVLAQTTVSRLFVAPGSTVVREPVDKDGVVGTLFHPGDGEPHPVVICL